MMKIFESLVSLVASDRSGRGPARLCSPECISYALDLLRNARRVAVVTGFFIPSAGTPETDGPGGSVALARAISRSGRDVSLWTDGPCLSVLSAASGAIGGCTAEKADDGADILDWDPDLIVYIERLGRAVDGRYYNMRGHDVSDTVTPLDSAAVAAAHKGISVIGIGDGGNEVGMGGLRSDLEILMPSYAGCLSIVEADAALPVDVSDWGGYALAGAVSLTCGKWCGIDSDEVRPMIEAEINAGAVDGVTLKGEPSVDGFPLDVQISTVADIEFLMKAQLPSLVP